MSAVCLIFAGDHGVAAAGGGGASYEIFPVNPSQTTKKQGSVTTKSILRSLNEEVAVASVLALENDVSIRVIDVGVANHHSSSFDKNAIVRSHLQKLRGGTRNICNEAAMTVLEAKRCIGMGREELWKCNTRDDKFEIVALGEVGVGNKTSCLALVAALTGADPKKLLACSGKEVEIVKRALERHREVIQRFHAHQGGDATARQDVVMAILAALGGSEIAALVGAILEASDLQEQRESAAAAAEENDKKGTQALPVIVDGFIVSTAALVATRLKPRACRVMFLATKSAEPFHVKAIESIQAVAKNHCVLAPEYPLLDIGFRPRPTEEGTGAILAVPFLRSASAILARMPSWDDIPNEEKLILLSKCTAPSSELETAKVSKKEGEEATGSFVTRSKYFKALVRWAFTVCDADNTGSIQKEELYTGVLLVHLRMAKYVGVAATFPASRETVDKLFDASDTDKSGTIDEEEFTKIMVVCCGQVTSRIVLYLALLLFIVPCLAHGSVLVLGFLLSGQTWFQTSVHLLQASIAKVPLLHAMFDWDTLAEDLLGMGIFTFLFPVVFDSIDNFYQEAAEGKMLESLNAAEEN